MPKGRAFPPQGLRDPHMYHHLGSGGGFESSRPSLEFKPAHLHYNPTSSTSRLLKANNIFPQRLLLQSFLVAQSYLTATCLVFPGVFS